jgi:hypothetical protein
VTRISQRSDVVTLINVFTVAPEDQQRLLDLLAEATESVMSGLPGSYRPIYTRASTGRGLPTTPSGGAGRTSRRCSRTPRRQCT